MNLADLSVRRPVFATVLCLALVLVGVATLLELPVREHPNVAAPFVTVVTPYGGASADVVESQVTRRLEEQLAGLEGVRRITSYSSDGQSRITVEFSLDSDLEQSANDVRNRISRVGRLPAGVVTPRVVKAGSGIPPSIWITVRSDRHSILALTDIVQRQFVDRLASLLFLLIFPLPFPSLSLILILFLSLSVNSSSSSCLRFFFSSYPFLHCSSPANRKWID